MTTKGRIGESPIRNLKILITVQALWLAIVCVLAAWWGYLVHKSASRVAELEQKVGVSASVSHEGWLKTHRMLFWESSFFFGLLLTSSVLFFWLYYRDVKRSKSIQAFFAAFTHELRTPLTSIRLQAESIADQLGAEASGENSLVKRLLEDTQRLETQVERTLELSRLEGGGPLLLQNFDLKPVLERVIRNQKETFGGRLNVKLDFLNTEVLADIHAVEMIFKNLIENSVRYGTGVDQKVEVKINARRKSNWVEVHYSDSGTGYFGSAHLLGRLFEKGTHSQGAGVGLYLVCALTEKMGGKVSLPGGQGFPVTIQLKASTDFVGGENG